MAGDQERAEMLVPAKGDRLLKYDGVESLLQSIRHEWQGRSLIERVNRILPVDPSSACQRLFNAAIHDLREKVVVAGLDIAAEAASIHKLPPIQKQEDVEEYPTSRLIDLCYRMGLLTRAEWRRIQRSYEIRRDLEHEDDQYEAQLEDCVYIFKTSIEIVLSRDPIKPLRVTEVKEIVESPDELAPSSELLADYRNAPQPRQEAICKYLISTALNEKQADLVRQKCVEMLRHLEPLTQNPVRLAIAAYIQDKIGRLGLDLAHAKVANAIGAMPYLKQVQLRDFFAKYFGKMKSVGFQWKAHSEHGKLLEDLEDVGGLSCCPEELLNDFLSWLILAYVGEPGGYGMGINRAVFYSNSAAPIIRQLVKSAPSDVKQALRSNAKRKVIQGALTTKHISRRLDELLDIAEE